MKYLMILLGLVPVIFLSCNSNYGTEFSQQQNPEDYLGPIIDMHMHTGLPHDVPAGIPSLCRPEPCEGDGHATVDPARLMEKTIKAMNDHNITIAFLSGVNWTTVQNWAKTAPERFIPSPFILKPGMSELDELKNEYKSGRFSGMGEIGAQLNGIPPNDPSLTPYYQLAQELDLPVLIHTEGIGPYLPHFRSSAGRPLMLEDVLIDFPKLRMFVENAGYPFRDEMIAVMYQYPQLYVDVSTITWVIPRTAFYDYLEALIRAGLGKRLMFGTDQMVWPEKIGEAVDAINQAPFLTLEQKEDIFFDNAADFLRLSQEEILRLKNP